MTKLAEILGAALDARDEADRDEAVAAVATVAKVEPEQLTGLLEAGETTIDAEAFGRLVEALGVDAGEARNARRDDGLVLDGDELEWGELQEPLRHEVKLVEAGKGARPGTTKFDVVIIRPCEGGGPGARIYTQRMLEANAANFANLPMYWNHEDLGTLARRGHGSRDPRDLAGYLVESRWDPNFTTPEDAKKGYLKGAVRGSAELLLDAAKLVESLPKAVGLSINLDPTRLRAQRRTDGRMGTLVEGVVAGSGSVDLVQANATGAGGQFLRRLREAAEARGHAGPGVPYASDHESDLAALDRLSDSDIVDRVRLRESVVEQLAGGSTPEDDDVIDPEKLVEALSTGEGAELLDRLVESKVAQREDEIRAEAGADARAESRRELDLRDMRDEARRLVEASALPRLSQTATDDLLDRFALRDGSPAPALDLHDDVDGEGAVTKSKVEKLRESVEQAVEREMTKLREVNPTRVTGSTPLVESEAPGGEEKPPPDPLAQSMGLDPAKVREHQEVA